MRLARELRDGARGIEETIVEIASGNPQDPITIGLLAVMASQMIIIKALAELLHQSDAEPPQLPKET